MAIAASASISSSKIVGDDLGPEIVQGFEADGLDHSAFFEDAADDKKITLIDNGTESFEHVGHDDEIRKAGFVFQCDEDDVVRRHRTLADDDGTGDRDDLSPSQIAALMRGKNPKLGHVIADESHRVFADRDADLAKIGIDELE